MTLNIIDVWMQHPTVRFLEQPFFASLRRWQRQTSAPQEIPLEATIASMDQAGVRKALACAWWGPQGALISNEEVRHLVASHPDRFVGIASVNLAKPIEAIHELRKCVREYGFKGLRIVPWLWNLPPNDRHYYPLYAECIELGIPFCLQVGHTGPLCPSEPGRPIPYLDEVALDFPDLKIVAGHIGYPWTQEMIALATKYPNVYIDTSAYAAHRYPHEIVQFLKGRGREKVLFGTNYPMLTAQQCLEHIETLELPDEISELFFYKNAESVFSLA